MKAKLALVVPLVAVLALVLVAGSALGKAGSVTGGGWFINEVPPFGNKITFSFNALPTGEGTGEVNAVGRFQLIDHGSKTRMRGTIDSMWLTEPTGAPIQPSQFSGEVSIDGNVVSYTVNIRDGGEPGFGEGDKILISIDWTPTYIGNLGGGNLKIHPK